MNNKEVKSKADLSPFFFENKLYEFSQKKLNERDREAMKRMTTTSPEAKYKIGMVLLSLEYLEKIEHVSMDIDKNEMLLAAKRRDRISKLFNFLFFLLLTACFFTSGYMFLNTYYKGLLF
jgi:hypothetical protein